MLPAPAPGTGDSSSQGRRGSGEEVSRPQHAAPTGGTLQFSELTASRFQIDRLDLSLEEIHATQERAVAAGLLPRRQQLEEIPLAVPGFSSIKSFIRNKLQCWDRRLAESDLPVVSTHLGGSLATGMFWGPKDVAFAETHQRLPGIERVIEVDIHYYLQSGADPHSDSILSKFERALDVERYPEAEFVSGWGPRVPLQRLFSSFDIGHGTAVEFEVMVGAWDQIPEITPFWRVVFSRPEILWQSELRAALRAWKVERDVLWAEKDQENDECRWRVVAGYALRALIEQNRLHLKDPSEHHGLCHTVMREFSGRPHPIIAERVEQWLSGCGGQGGLDRPRAAMAPASERHVSVFFPEKLKAPLAPPWVSIAHEVQRRIRVECQGKHAPNGARLE